MSVTYAIDRQRWAAMTIHEQLGNIGSEVGRSFAAKRRNHPELLDGAVFRAIDLFDATLESLALVSAARAREVLNAKDQFLQAIHDHETTPEEMASLERYFLFFALLARRDR